VLSLVLIVLLVWFVATVVLAAWTLWFQAYIYSEPVGDIWWRAPAAGSALTLFLVVWMFCDYRAPGRYRELQGFTTTEGRVFKELRIETRESKKPEVYKERKDERGRLEYLRESSSGERRQLPSRPAKIIAVEGDKEYVFEPLPSQRDAKGNFQVKSGDSLRYRNADTGWEMTEGQLGRVSVFHGGWLLGNVLLNLLHFVVWFVSLWVLLRYQWSHALGLAVVFWLVTTLFVVPQMLTKAENVAQERAAAQVAK
jgi:hypothetical protein